MQVSRWIKSEKHQQLVERWWIAIVLLWDVIKSIAIDKAFSKYGVNPYVYFAIVVTIAVPYALTTAKMFFAILENHWRNSFIFGFAAGVMHFIPDIYILITAKHPPRTLLDGFLFIVFFFTFFGVREIIVRVRKHKK